MEKEKEKSGRKYRESDHDLDMERESDRRHHRHHGGSKEKEKYRYADDERHRHRSDRRSSREYSVDRENAQGRDPTGDLLRTEREGSRDRYRREKSHEREDSVERRHSKRKERGESGEGGYVDGEVKRARVVEEKRERKRFEEDVNGNGRREEKKEKRRFEDSGESKENREERREKRRFDDQVKKEEEGEKVEKVRTEARNSKKEPKEEAVNSSSGDLRSGGSNANDGAIDLHNNAAPRTSLDTPLSENHSPASKVSSISNTNENKGVNINRSHEVPGKSSTDGTSSEAGKSGGLSVDALAKAKRALQMQKELAEKLKKIPLLKKGVDPPKEGSPLLALKDGVKPTTTSPGLLSNPSGNSSAAVSTGISKNVPALPSGEALDNPPVSGLPHLAGLTTQKYEAVKRAHELAAKMGFRQDPEFAPLINMFPGQIPPEVSLQPKPAKAPILRLDALGREIDEHGNVINIPKANNLSTLKVNINKKKKDAFQILKPVLEVDPEQNPHFDAGMGIDKNKLLRPKRMSFQFVEEGKWSRDAEMLKIKSQFAELRTKELKAKQAQLAKAKSEPDINPNLIEVSERIITREKPKEPIPEIEWWDVPLLQSGSYGGIGDAIDGNIADDKLKLEKITIYVEHPRPIEPPAEPVPPPPQPLKLTKKEQKKLRTQRRLAREKEKQEMIRQGLIEPPKPKVKMSNLMKVLGSEATQDPTKLEMEIRSAAADREQAHIDRNIARKLTPAERREKKERKLFDDPNSVETIVSVYKINNLSHPKARFKVDANAHENRLTGCAVISEGISVVIVEGCPKSIKRYGKLMLRRVDWAAAVKNEDEEDVDDAPVNKCLLVWQGSVAKPSFTRFSVHDCRTEAAGRKIFFDAGVGHYWDLAVNFTEDIEI